jgi:hypothetical protein
VLRLWSHDTFGQDLIINPRNGAIYYWTASSGTGTRAVPLSTPFRGHSRARPVKLALQPAPGLLCLPAKVPRPDSKPRIHFGVAFGT